MLNEDRIIQSLKRSFTAPGGIGDDAAIFPFIKEESYVITKDLLIEDIHFKTQYTPIKCLAEKSLQVNLSDIAAMGATPKYVLLGISIPKHWEQTINSFLSHFVKACKKSDVELIGGDTTGSKDKLFISITAIGIVKNSQIKLRSSAKDGDTIFVAGNLGYAHIGLKILEKNLSGAKAYKKAHLTPQAKIQEGIWLALHNEITSMMDLSDGLYVDLKKLSLSSGLSAQIYIESLANDNLFTKACRKIQLDPIETMLIGGEDYSLLGTVETKETKRIQKLFYEKFGYPLKIIGKTVKGKKGSIIFMKKGKIENLQLNPFSHF